MKAVANHKKIQGYLGEICELAERQRKAEQTDLSWVLILRHSFKRDIDDLSRITSILTGSDSNALKELINLTPEEISRFMDLLQSVREHPFLSNIQ